MRSVCLVVRRSTLGVQAAIRVLAFLTSPSQPPFRHTSAATSLHGGTGCPPRKGGRGLARVDTSHAP